MAMRCTPLVSSEVGKTLICIDGVVDCDIAGRLYNIYMPEPVAFVSILGLVNAMESFFDEIAFPQTYYADRSFNQRAKTHVKPKTYGRTKKEVRQHMSEDILTTEQGKKATFMVQVQFRQNSTWQGTITWVDDKKTQRFRSALEMIKLMDQALSAKEADGAAPESAWQ